MKYWSSYPHIWYDRYIIYILYIYSSTVYSMDWFEGKSIGNHGVLPPNNWWSWTLSHEKFLAETIPLSCTNLRVRILGFRNLWAQRVTVLVTARRWNGWNVTLHWNSSPLEGTNCASGSGKSFDFESWWSSLELDMFFRLLEHIDDSQIWETCNILQHPARCATA